jgi:hypothetical protein
MGDATRTDSESFTGPAAPEKDLTRRPPQSGTIAALAIHGSQLMRRGRDGPFVGQSDSAFRSGMWSSDWACAAPRHLPRLPRRS